LPEQLIAKLPSGPLDIVGDVHGERQALEALLGHLGYAQDGTHPDARSLVFVGDLIDRGPDSPGVLKWVRKLVFAGRAFCIAGNHELNLLRGDLKQGNRWWTAPEEPDRYPMLPINELDRDDCFQFMDSLPLVLERDDLRVVHACWSDPLIDRLRKMDGESHGLAALYDYFTQQTTQAMLDNRFLSFVRREWRQHNPKLEDPEWQATYMPALAELNTRAQNDNPVAVLTSGTEIPAGVPFWAGGKWRMVTRELWWETYDAGVPVVFGHYWRRSSSAADAFAKGFGPDVLAASASDEWLGPARSAYCIDFSVGARAEFRRTGRDVCLAKLAAVRVPEWQVVHDDGSVMELGPPG